MIGLDVAKATVLLFVVVIIQVSILNGVEIVYGRPEVLLVAVVCVALLRGSVFGAIAGFAAGLVADTGTLAVLGLTSLLLTLAGYWTGRYGETTGRDRAHAPLLSVAVVTFVYELGALILHFMLGQPAPATTVLGGLIPTIVLNVLLTVPVYALIRRVLRPHEWSDRAREVRLLG